MSNLAVVLLDVGGTLWPDTWQEREDAAACRAANVVAALPWLSHDTAFALVAALGVRAAALTGDEKQATRALVREVAQALRLSLDDMEAAQIQLAMCLPAAGRVELLPGARELLATTKALGLRCVIISNTVWRDAEMYRRDFDALGLARFVDAFISSADVGFRKPHLAMFEAALAAVGGSPDACVMIGDSEQNDVEPALALKMRTIRVAIEQPVPATSAAHAIVRSLHEASEMLRSWTWAC